MLGTKIVYLEGAIAMNKIYQGDAFPLMLDYTVDNIPLVDFDVDEIEFYIGDKQYLLSAGDIVLDTDINKYALFVEQETTFKFDKFAPFQLRLKKNNQVVGEKIGRIPVGDSISRTVI